MKVAFAFLFAFAGCVATLPPDDPTVSADLACEVSRAIVQMRAAKPDAPSDNKPKPGDKCEPCNGTGKLPTDGRVVVPCGACDGTGRVR